MYAMGKEKKKRLHQALAEQILATGAPRPSTRAKQKSTKTEECEGYVGDRLSRRILETARLQQEDLEDRYGVGGIEQKKRRRTPSGPPGGRIHLGGASGGDSDEEEEEEEEAGGGQDVLGSGSDADCCPTVGERDERAVEMFMNRDAEPRRTLADIIMDKIRDKQTEIASHGSEAASSSAHMDEKVVSVFKGVGQILSKYRSGKLPKAFKVIPSLSNWEEVLFLTEPEKWSAAATFQATRIFCSNLSAVKAQRFYNLVLLPRIRDDISEYKRLNFHLYMALKKSLFKPAAFFKGILLPLCESGTCTLREALIVGSVLAKTSIPMLHSSAALLRMAEMEYSGANSVFIRTLLDKKYALPYRVVDACVFHFLRFATEPRDLPVLWHQSLLTFVQRYKEDISVEQKEALLELIRLKAHHDITPEIRREIVNSKCRDLDAVFMNRQKVPALDDMVTD